MPPIAHIINRRRFLKRGALFIPATWGVRRALAQSLNLADGPFIISNARDCSAAATVVNSWATRVLANGGAALSAATKNATQNFVCTLQAAGLWSKMITVNIFAPDNLTACITPLLVGPAFDPFGNQGFVAGDLTVNGLKSNGTTKRLDTSIKVTTGYPSGQNVGMSVYVSATLADGVTMGGASDTSVNWLEIAVKYSDNAYHIRNGGISNEITAASPGAGYYSTNRVAAADHKAFFANSTTPHAQLGATDVLNYAGPGESIQMMVFAINVNTNPTPTLPCSDRISYTSWHQGFIASESLTQFNAIQALRTALGGGSV